MVNSLWFGKNKLYWLLIPFSLLYGAITLLRKQLYKWRIFSSWQAPIPVVVVGNLSVGGNGKTPVVISLVEHLQQIGYKVGVVSRGYGGKSAHYPVIVNSDTPTATAGDEPVLIHQRTGAPLAVSPKRSDAIKALLADYQLDIIITDDGLQHYALARDIEIVVIDGKRGFGNGCFLPAGPMRETASRLNSVDFIIINGPTDISFNDKTTYTMQLKHAHAINLLTREQRSVTELANIHAIAGIGDPNRFFNMLKTLNVDIIGETGFADHQNYSQAVLQNLLAKDEVLLMTEKDAVKCQSFAQQNWWYLPISGELPDRFYFDFFNKIKRL